MNFKESKELYWFIWLNQTIPQDLQSLYRDDINKMKAGYITGIEFALEYYGLKDEKNDKQRTG